MLRIPTTKYILRTVMSANSFAGQIKVMQSNPQIRQQMFSLITHWQQSGLTQKAYCDQQAIKYHVFHYWYKCYRDEQAGVGTQASGFVKLHVARPASAAIAELQLPDGKRIMFYDLVSSEYLKALLGYLCFICLHRAGISYIATLLICVKALIVYVVLLLRNCK